MKRDLGFVPLVGVIVGSTIGSGVFSLAGDMAANGAHTGAVLVGWAICLIGMLSLSMCFFHLNREKPELTNGIYSYAKEGYGDYVGFFSAWGYWISALFCNVSYATLLFAAVGYFFPVFGVGNNIPSIVGASIIIWLMNWIVLKGVREAAGVNLVVAICKILPLFVFIIAIIFVRAFDPAIFMDNFWGEPGGMSFLDQVKATTGATVWSFIGIEGAVVLSGRARRNKDVGKSTVIGFLCIFLIYLMISIMSMGVMPTAELAGLGNPPLAGILEKAVGKWGAALINLGVMLSLLGAFVGWTIIAADCPYSAAKQGVFTKAFAKENKNGAPEFSLYVTNGIIQLFLIIIYFKESTYQAFYNISASMIMVPYLFSSLYFLKLSFQRENNLSDLGRTGLAKLFAIIGSIYGFWMIYSSGLDYFLITTILYAPGIVVYILGKKEKNERYLNNIRDKVVSGALVALGVISFVLILNGTINPF